MKKLITLAAAVALCAGCASKGGWWRADTTEAQFHQDRFGCERDAATMYPTVISSVGGYSGPSQTNCTTYGSSANCTTTPGVNVAPVQVDVNQRNRENAMQSCLLGKGYTWRTK